MMRQVLAMLLEAIEHDEQAYRAGWPEASLLRDRLWADHAQAILGVDMRETLASGAGDRAQGLQARAETTSPGFARSAGVRSAVVEGEADRDRAGARTVTNDILAVLWESIEAYRLRRGTVPSRLVLGREEWRQLLARAPELLRGPAFVHGVYVEQGNW